MTPQQQQPPFPGTANTSTSKKDLPSLGVDTEMVEESVAEAATAEAPVHEVQRKREGPQERGAAVVTVVKMAAVPQPAKATTVSTWRGLRGSACRRLL